MRRGSRSVSGDIGTFLYNSNMLLKCFCVHVAIIMLLFCSGCDNSNENLCRAFINMDYFVKRTQHCNKFTKKVLKAVFYKCS
jgi:hypothetical protein